MPQLDSISGEFQRDALFAVLTIGLGLAFIAGNNIMTPEEPVDVGYVEIDTHCVGIDTGICLGIQRQSHTTYNYDNYTEPEPGTPNFYRRVEAELMAQAYNICTEEMEGMEWLSEASYRNKTGEKWAKNDNVDLLGCEKTFYRDLAPERSS